MVQQGRKISNTKRYSTFANSSNFHPIISLAFSIFTYLIL